jgi:hypothetical protein
MWALMEWVQLVEHQPSKCEALSSILPKKKNQKENVVYMHNGVFFNHKE